MTDGRLDQFKDLIFLDVETTGLLFQPESRIVEISLSLWNSAGHVIRHSSLINPQEHIPDIYTQIHGINDRMVKDAPTFLEFWRDFGRLFEEKTIVAHNLSFDMGMINKELTRLEKPPLGNSGIDTVPILRKLLPEEKNHKLQNLAQSLGVSQEKRHRAEEDVRALEMVLSLAMDMPLEHLTGPLGIDLALWGGISSHRYFRDLVAWAQQNETEINIILARKDHSQDPGPLRLESIRIEKPAYTAKRVGEYRDKGRYPISWSQVYRLERY